MNSPPTVLGAARSVLGRMWRPRLGDDRLAMALAQRAGVPEPFARILAGRGVEADRIAAFLSPRIKDEMPSPLSVVDVRAAASRLHEALELGEPITVFADFDVDGATSGAILIRYLRAAGAKIDWYVPDRLREGYGPNIPAIDILKARGTRLIVFVDCGTAAIAELSHAKGLGLVSIVVDHHQPGPELPAASAVVNPMRDTTSNRKLNVCSAGLAFILVAALDRILADAGWFKERARPDILGFLDLVALGTVCDVMPLSGLNRAYVSQGLKVLGSAPNPGLAALAAIAGAKGPFSPYHLGFILGPRINAGGRVGTSDLGIRLLTSDDPAEINALALHLDVLNRERQAIEKAALDEAMVLATAMPRDLPLTFVAREGWHPGVVGIVAGRLKDAFFRPSLVGAIEGGTVKCSLRSIEGIDIGAVIATLKAEGLALSGGGHAMAAGLSFSRDMIAAVETRMMALIAPLKAAAPDARAYDIDAVMQPGSITPDFLTLIGQAAPFGQGNAEPVFVLSDVTIASASQVGAGHVAVELTGSGSRIRGIAFRAAENALGGALRTGARLHVAGRLKANEWGGRAPRPEILIDDAAIP